MPGRPVRVTDELLFRVITGAATETEREALGLWLESSPTNVQRFQELAGLLQALAQDEAGLQVPPAPALSGILARARLSAAAGGSQRRRAILGPVTAALAAAIMVIGVAVKTRPEPTSPPPLFGGEQMSTSAERSVAITLRDGTRVELGPQTTIHTALRGETREVFLEGRASFVVAHQAAHPFVVRTSVGETRDIGTQFTVRVDRGSMQVAVFEGRVGFSNPSGSVEAGAGEMIATSTGRRPVVSSLAAGHTASDWVRAALVFERNTVNDVARVLEQHYGVPVHVADGAVGRRTVSAWFVQEPSLEEVFAAVCRAVDATCSVDGSRRVIAQ